MHSCSGVGQDFKVGNALKEIVDKEIAFYFFSLCTKSVRVGMFFGKHNHGM